MTKILRMHDHFNFVRTDTKNQKILQTYRPNPKNIKKK